MGDGYAVEEYARTGKGSGDVAVGIELRGGQRGRSQVGAEDGDDLARRYGERRQDTAGSEVELRVADKKLAALSTVKGAVCEIGGDIVLVVHGHGSALSVPPAKSPSQ